MSINLETGAPAHQSLYDYLTTMTATEQSPITKPSITFIQAIAQNACKAKRNVQTLCRIARRACEICDTVTQQLDRASEEMDFETMENCGTVVEKLEQLLSDALVLSTDESVADPDNSVQHWARNRDILNEVLLSLYNPPFDPAAYAWDEDLLTSRRHDDIVWIDRVSESIEQQSSKDDDQVAISKVIGDMKSALRKVPLDSKDTSADAAMVLTTKCIMKTFSVIKKSEDTENEGPAKQTRDSKQLDLAKGIMEDLLSSMKANAPDASTTEPVPSDPSGSNPGSSNPGPSNPDSINPGPATVSPSIAHISKLDELQAQWDKLEASATFGLQPSAPVPKKAKGIRPEPSTPAKKKGKEKKMFRLKTVFEAPNETGASSSTDRIIFAEIDPGYLVYRRIKDSTTTYIRDLRPDSLHRRNVVLPQVSRMVAINEARTMLAYCVDDGDKNYVRLAPLPFDTFLPVSEIEAEGTLVHVFWMQRDIIGFLNQNGDFFTTVVALENRRTVLKPAQWLFSLPDHSTVERDRLCLSVAMSGQELAWLAFNITVDGLPKVHVWSQKVKQAVVMDGIGTLSSVVTEGEPHTLLVTTAPKMQPENESLSFSVYDLDHRLLNRPFPILNTEVELDFKTGKPSFIHVFQPQGVAFIVLREQREAHGVLCDIHTGLRLQETPHHATMLGTFAPLSPGEGTAGTGLLVLHPRTNMVERFTIFDDVLKAKRMEWLSYESS